MEEALEGKATQVEKSQTASPTGPREKPAEQVSNLIGPAGRQHQQTASRTGRVGAAANNSHITAASSRTATRSHAE